MNRTLDRKVYFDPKSKNFPIRELVPSKPRSFTWSCKAWLDQGQEGACVGFSWSHELAARPVIVPNITNRTAQALYKAAQGLDDEPGDNYEGTTVLAGAKAVQALGHMSEYRWAFGVDDLILAVGHAGPAVLGINWYNDMFQPDGNGLVKPTGGVAGGHAILCNGVNIKKQLFRLHNSWGESWGVDGDCFVSFDDMDKLLQDSGEACIPVHRIK